MTSQAEIEQLALRIWQAREMTYPERVRRMQPDRFDYATGAWAQMLGVVEQQLVQEGQLMLGLE